MQHLCGIDFLYLIFGFPRMLWQFFYPFWQKNRRTFVSAKIKTFHFEYNTLRHLTYYKQRYCKDIQICASFANHEG